MPFFSIHVGHARAFALAGAVTAVLGASAVHPAFAGDDGQEPIWQGIGDLLGLAGVTGKEKEAPIDYHERGRLVLPPKMGLPPPAASAAGKTAAWPLDPDVEKVRKAKEERLSIMKSQSDLQAMRDGHRVSPDELRSDHSPPGSAGVANRCAHTTPSRNCSKFPFSNVMETIGLAKADDIVAGQEPDRDWLTDPPKGYRVPTSNTSVKFDAGDAKKPNDRDPRAALYHAPENP
jgi:hypothetical protein